MSRADARLAQGHSLEIPSLGGVAVLANNGKILSKGTIAATPALVITGVSFSPNPVNNGSSFSATMAGSNLTSQTNFDVLFQAPGNSAYIEALNWQTGSSASHTVRFGTATGPGRSAACVRIRIPPIIPEVTFRYRPSHGSIM